MKVQDVVKSEFFKNKTKSPVVPLKQNKLFFIGFCFVSYSPLAMCW